MRLLILPLLLSFLGLHQAAVGQGYSQQKGQVLFVNLAGNAIMGGMGACINKPANEKRSVAFLKGFLKGALGGAVKYTAKLQSKTLADQSMHFYSHLNRLHYFLGHSLVMNAAHGKRFMQTYYFNLYGIDLRVSLKDTQKVKARLSAATLLNVAWFGIRGFRFNINKSLEFGLFYFDIPRSASQVIGTAGFNCIAIEPPPPGYNYISNAVWPHEVVHTYQAYDYFSLSAIYERKLNKKLEKYRVLNSLGKFFVADYEVLFFEALYFIQPQPRYYRNYFEFEAQHFATRVYVPRVL